jgi:hypothetical protein
LGKSIHKEIASTSMSRKDRRKVCHCEFPAFAGNVACLPSLGAGRQSHSVIFYCLLPWALHTAISVQLNLLIALLDVVLAGQKPD